MKIYYKEKGVQSRAVNAENPKGEAGRGGMASSILGPSRKGSPCLKDIKSGEKVVLADITGPGVINHIWITVDKKTCDGARFVLRDIIIRMYWDDEEEASVEAPLGDFFCSGFAEDCLIDSALITIAPARGLNSWFEMPFRKRARIEIENQHENTIPAFFYQIDYTIGNNLSDDVMYFHSSFRREKITTEGVDYTIIDGIKGEGRYLGTFIALSSLERYWWGEGEVKFYIDDDELYPTICGTGMEDYFGGSWSFAEQREGRTVEKTYSDLYFGYPFYSRDDSIYNQYHNSDVPPMRSFYRWHISDPIYFSKSLKVTVQQIGVSHSGLFERRDDLSSVAYWYQREPHVPFLELPGKKDRWPR